MWLRIGPVDPPARRTRHPFQLRLELADLLLHRARARGCWRPTEDGCVSSYHKNLAKRLPSFMRGRNCLLYAWGVGKIGGGKSASRSCAARTLLASPFLWVLPCGRAAETRSTSRLTSTKVRSVSVQTYSALRQGSEGLWWKPHRLVPHKPFKNFRESLELGRAFQGRMTFRT
jgi:hypothetical protein